MSPTAASRFLPAHFLTLASAAIVLAALPPGRANPPGFPPFASGEYAAAGLAPHEPDVTVEYPGTAAMNGIPSGTATVTVLVDAAGKPQDFLVVGYSHPAFGTALREQLRTCHFQPARFRGTAVPGRYDYTYYFETSAAVLYASGAAAVGAHPTDPVVIYKSVPETKIDGSLEFLTVAFPPLPEGFKAPDDKPVKVYVTFFIDETGHVRIPKVESASSPLLIPGAIAAIQQWTFKPPLVKGKPALVYTGRPVKFMPRTK